MDSCVTVSAIRDRIEVALTAAGYLRSRHVPELFGRDTDGLIPKSFSVAAPSSVIADFDERGNYGDEGEAQTIVEVRTGYRLRADDQSGDYGRALDHEHQVIRAVLGGMDTTYIQVGIQAVPSRRVTAAGDWLISTIRFRVYHRFILV